MNNSQTTSERISSGEIPPLSRLYFYLTEGCNLACRHCWLAPKFDPEANEYPCLPVDVLQNAIREAKPLGLTDVKLTGGEPLMHPHIHEILEIIISEKIRLVMETNGIMCTREIAEMVARTERPFVSVSIDGTNADTHEWMRGVKGSFERSLSALRNLVEAGIKPQIIMTILRRNSGQISDMVSMAEQLGVASIKFNILQPMARGATLHSTGEIMSVQEILRLRQWVDEELTSHTGIKLFFDVPLAFRPLSRIDEGDRGTCGIKGILGVIPSGHYALCGVGEHIADLVFGEVGYDALHQIWGKNPVLNEIRNGLPGKLEGVCSRCLMAGSCLGSCVAQNYYRTGNLWTSFWLCEQAETQGIFPASRLKAGSTYHQAVEPIHG